MKASELRAKKADELKKLMLDLLQERLNLRIQKSVGQLKKTHRFQEIRKDVAKIKMVLAELKKEAAVSAA